MHIFYIVGCISLFDHAFPILILINVNIVFLGNGAFLVGFMSSVVLSSLVFSDVSHHVIAGLK